MAGEKGRPGVMLYFELGDALEALPLEQAGELVISLLRYAKSGIEPQLSGPMAAVWALTRPKIDADELRYKARVEAARVAAKKRWQSSVGMPTHADASESMPTHADGMRKMPTTTATAATATTTTCEGKADKPPARKKAFSPPTVSEVAAYCAERQNGIDPEMFCAYYESRGWKLGKTPMRSWKAAVVTWERRSKTGQPAAPDYTAPPGFEFLDGG